MRVEPREEPRPNFADTRVAIGASLGPKFARAIGHARLRSSGRRAWLALTLPLACLGCNDRAPWDREASGGPPPSLTHEAPVPSSEPSAAFDAEGKLDRGGIFVSCMDGLRTTADATRDVKRLGLACGPVAGMKRAVDAVFEGTLSPGAPSLEYPIDLKRGRCYRIFIATESAGPQFTVEVVSSHGLPIAGEQIDKGLGAVPADRPLCALGDDRGTLRVTLRCPPSEGPNGPCPQNGARFALDLFAR